MGEVFRAKDTRLVRVVAIKVLPYAKVADPERTGGPGRFGNNHITPEAWKAK